MCRVDSDSRHNEDILPLPSESHDLQLDEENRLVGVCSLCNIKPGIYVAWWLKVHAAFRATCNLVLP